MAETRIEIQNLDGGVEIPVEICCNCGATNDLRVVPTELKLTRFFGLGGSEYTFAWELPYCSGCASSASRHPANTTHTVLVVALGTVALFLALTTSQMALGTSLFGGYDFWVALGLAVLLVAGFRAWRRPEGMQTSHSQPVRIRKLRQKFSTGEVTGIVLGFTNPVYLRRFREANAASLAAPTRRAA